MKQIGVAEKFEEITGYKIRVLPNFRKLGWLHTIKNIYRDIPVDACGTNNSHFQW